MADDDAVSRRGREIARRGCRACRRLREQIVHPALQPAEHERHGQFLQRLAASERVAVRAGRQLLERPVAQRPVLVAGERERGERRAARFREQARRIVDALRREPRRRRVG